MVDGGYLYYLMDYIKKGIHTRVNIYTKCQKGEEFHLHQNFVFPYLEKACTL